MNLHKCPSKGHQSIQMALSMTTVLILMIGSALLWYSLVKEKGDSMVTTSVVEFGPKNPKQAMVPLDLRTLEKEEGLEIDPSLHTYKPLQHIWIKQEFCSEDSKDVEILRAFIDEQGGRQTIPSELTRIEAGCHPYESVVRIPKELQSGPYYIEQKLRFQHNFLGAQTTKPLQDIPIYVTALD